MSKVPLLVRRLIYIVLTILLVFLAGYFIYTVGNLL